MIGKQWALSFLVLAILVAAIPGYSATAQETLTAGFNAADSGNTAAAKDLLSQVVSQFPESPQAAEASWKLGSIFMEEKNRKEARLKFLWLVEHHPTSEKAPDALMQLASIALQAGQHDKRVQYLTRIIDNYPLTTQAQIARLQRANRYIEREKYELALADLAILKGNENLGTDMRAAATVAEGQARMIKWKVTKDSVELERAMTTLESVRESFPNSLKQVAFSRLAIAMHYNYSGRFNKDSKYPWDPAKGRQILEDAIRNLPENYYTWWMKVDIVDSYSAEKRYQDAISECMKLLNEKPSKSWKVYLLYLAGLMQLKKGDRDAGISLLKQLVTEFPGDKWSKLAQDSINYDLKRRELYK